MAAELHIPGLIGIIVFYLLILAIGIYAAWKSRSDKEADTEDVMLAGRNIGLVVGMFSMTATWVGGGYINGTAEYVYAKGLVWTQAPIGFSISLIVGGFVFARKMREAGYVTMLDPIQRKYGQRMGGLLYLPALSGDLFWSAAILSALGASLSVILGLDITVSIIVSACISVFYTLIGGLYSVAFTDVVQMICVFVGMWLTIPFAFMHPAVTSIAETKEKWLGTVEVADSGYYVDHYLLLIFGGIPWQVYFQRVLSSKTAKRAQYLSYAAGVGCFLMAIPPILIGSIAASTDWNATDYRLHGELPIPEEQYSMVLPLVLRYLTPNYISFVGLGAVSAAVMSSADSSVLAASSMFARNVYQNVFRQSASEKEVIWVMRGAVLVVGALAAILGITVKSVGGLFLLCADLVYVILFPQLVCAVFVPSSNTYGALTGYILGLLIRVLGGEPLLNFPAAVKYPWYDENHKLKQLFPFRTLGMAVSFISIILVSLLTNYLFRRNILAKEADIFQCVVNLPDKEEDNPKENGEINMALSVDKSMEKNMELTAL